jgi:hypothetical protein
MESYQTWFGERPEVSVLRMLGLFDRPANEKALGALLKPPAIPGLTESLTGLSPSEWRTVLAKLRRARLLAGEDPQNPGQLDTHPLIREYFGEQLRSQRTEAWKECNKRLYHYYRTLAPQLPDTFSEMEPLFLAVICGCNAGLYREALQEVYIPRIQRGDSSFAAKVLGARGALLLILAHFFESGRSGSPVQTGAENQSLRAEDQLFILKQAAVYMTATRESAPEARLRYERAEALCHSLHRPLDLYVALIGQWRYTLMTEKLSVAFQIAKRLHALAMEQHDARLMIGACNAMANTPFWMGDFETALRYQKRGVAIWRSGGVRSHFEEVDSQAVACLCHEGLFQWHSGETATCRAVITEAILLAQEQSDKHGLALAMWFLAMLGYFERNSVEVERLASELIELSTRQHFEHFLALGMIYRGWARSASGDATEGISWIEDGIRDYRAGGSVLMVPLGLAIKAEALHLAKRTSEALDATSEADALSERFEGRWLSSELHRLRGVSLAAMGADEAQIEASFRAAISTAKKRKLISLAKRAEESYAEYCGRKPRT